MLWCGETGDIWNDHANSFAAAKRTLYTAIRHQQLTFLEHLIASPHLRVDLMIECARVLVPRFADLGLSLPHLEHLARVSIAGVLAELAALRRRLDADAA